MVDTKNMGDTWKTWVTLKDGWDVKLWVTLEKNFNLQKWIAFEKISII